MALLALRLLAQTVAFLVLALPAWGAVQLSLNTELGQVDKPFELQIEVSQYTSVIGAPDLEPLQQDFKIHANRSVYLTEKRGGRTIFISRWTISLSPKRAGSLIIPALNVKGESSQPLPFQVQPKPKPKAEPLILKTELDTLDAYQGSPIELSVKLYYSLNLQSAALTQPRIEGVAVEQLGEQLNYTASLNQQRYQVIEQKYLLQALKTGRYRIPELRFNGTDESGNPLSSASKPLEFDILPLPNNLFQQIRLVASEVRLEQQWQQPLNSLRAGDTLNRTITLVAHGVPAQWLPDISLPIVEGISVYPQPEQLHNSSTNDVLVSRKTIEFKMLLTKPGLQHLPEISIQWWDSVRNKPETALLASMDIQVLPFAAELTEHREPDHSPTTQAPATSLAAKSSADKARSDTATQWQAWVWAAIALICAIGWSLSQQRSKRFETELALLKQAPKPEPTSAVSDIDPTLQHNSFSALTEACENNDPELAYRFLLDWAAAHWPGMRVRTLEDIEELAKDPTLTYLLKNLHHQLQDPSDSWHGDLLIQRIRRLRQQTSQSQIRTRQNLQSQSPEPLSSQLNTPSAQSTRPQGPLPRPGQPKSPDPKNGRGSIRIAIKD